MGPGILGKKIGMTQVFRPNGEVVPVTLVKAGPCVVVQRKTPTTDGYDAVQLGLVEFVKAARINKPLTGHLKKANADGMKFLKELRLRPGDDDLKPGDKILVDQFKAREIVDVTGVSKGRGFAGIVFTGHHEHENTIQILEGSPEVGQFGFRAVNPAQQHAQVRDQVPLVAEQGSCATGQVHIHDLTISRSRAARLPARARSRRAGTMQPAVSGYAGR